MATSSAGQLLVASNTRLVFTPCYEFLNLNVQGNSVAGEPTMEKVIAFRYFYGPFLPDWKMPTCTPVTSTGAATPGTGALAPTAAPMAAGSAISTKPMTLLGPYTGPGRMIE